MTTKNRVDSGEADGLLVLALASGCTYVEAADRGGVGVSTVSRRMRSHVFRRRVTEQRAELIERGAGCMADELAVSVRFLAKVRDDDDLPTALRIRATTALIGSALRNRQLDPSPSYQPTAADLDNDFFDFVGRDMR